MWARYRLTVLVASKPRQAIPAGVFPDHTETVTQSTGRAAAFATPTSASSRFEQKAKVGSPVGGPTLQSNPKRRPTGEETGINRNTA
jgi:hypothetical protein